MGLVTIISDFDQDVNIHKYRWKTVSILGIGAMFTVNDCCIHRVLRVNLLITSVIRVSEWPSSRNPRCPVSSRVSNAFFWAGHLTGFDNLLPATFSGSFMKPSMPLKISRAHTTFLTRLSMNGPKNETIMATTTTTRTGTRYQYSWLDGAWGSRLALV